MDFVAIGMFFTLDRYSLQLNMLFGLGMFFTLNRFALQLNMPSVSPRTRKPDAK